MSLTHTHTHFWRVLSPRLWVKHEKERKRGNFEDFHLSSEELFLILISKRMKVTTEDTGAVSVESQDFRVLNQGGCGAHFFEVRLWSWRNFSKLSRRDLEKYQSVAKTHRFSALVSSCWGSDSTVTYNLLVSTLASPPECIARHPAVRHFPQRLNWFEFHTASGLNIQILNTYLRYSDISRCQNSLGRQHLLVNQKHCNLLWLELVNALSLSVWHTHTDTLALF